MQKKTSLLAAALLASLTFNSSVVRAQTAAATPPAPVTAAPSTGGATAPKAPTTPTPAAPAASAAATASGTAATTASAAGTPVAGADLTKLPKASDKTGLTFDKDIGPIFKASCVGCHAIVGADGATRRASGGLDLSSLATTLKGGAQAKAKDVAPGHADQSLVVLRTVNGAIAGNLMPRGGKPLTDDQVGLIMAWINQGAK
jgi:hypothetical protein